jgi:hypothetical protein
MLKVFDKLLTVLQEDILERISLLGNVFLQKKTHIDIKVRKYIQQVCNMWHGYRGVISSEKSTNEYSDVTAFWVEVEEDVDTQVD